ncbi:hypothetical protein Ami103574_12825 [Aminipila butyrica]|uniref:Dna polymerase iii delta subunit n=1 Tax=Aminipila butyrica TaxID=433296 RepID=A0A858BW05_9FIRM|nr:hypothetical protein [Aminipila butyrica]QIB70123.1 hypothetical protein Ami103574_12825 [Aminipila butyrica]
MILRDIDNNRKLMERLGYLSASQNLSHAYIFEGDACVDKELLANCFIKAILCEEHQGEGCDSCISCNKINHGNYEDILYVAADGKSIKDEAIEELQGRLQKKPFFGDRNIAVIKQADTMTVRAQNRLLKTLEEPPRGTILILLSENTENLIPTILSRCVAFRVEPFETPEYGQIKENAQELVRMLLNRDPFYALKAKLGQVAEDKDAAMKLLDGMELIYRDLAIANTRESRNYTKESIYRAVEWIEEARRDLQRGMNTGYAMKNLMIKIGG